MSQLRFSASLGLLFQEVPFYDRFAAAAAAGFTTVEYMFPYDYDIEAIARLLEQHGLQQDLFNLPAGDFAAGERGIATDPSRRREFRTGVERAAEVAQTLGCQKLNCLVGNQLPGLPWDEQYKSVVENLNAATATLNREGITLHVELLNLNDAPGFFLHDPDLVARLLDDVPGLRFQADLYHLQRAHGDLATTLERLADRLGHVQIADSPDRHEPGTGEIHYPYIFDLLERIGYDGSVALEYQPSTTTAESLRRLSVWRAVKSSRPESTPEASSSTQRRIAFIGLGIMGRPMARNLATAGFDLVVHSRSRPPVDELASLGATVASSPRDAARTADTVILMLPDTPDVEAVLFGRGGVAEGAAPGATVIDMSSISPTATRRFAERLAAQEVTLIDAPVSGGEKGAIEATLSIMVGGPRETFEQVERLLSHLGQNVVYVGPTGAGQVAKACNQLVVAVGIEAVAEALVLAKAAGVEPARVREALLGGFAGSRILELHGERMLTHNFEPGFRLRLHAKDARIIRELAAASHVSLPAFEPVSDALDALTGNGLGELDHAALATRLEQRAGVSVAD